MENISGASGPGERKRWTKFSRNEMWELAGSCRGVSLVCDTDAAGRQQGLAHNIVWMLNPSILLVWIFPLGLMKDMETLTLERPS